MVDTEVEVIRYLKTENIAVYQNDRGFTLIEMAIVLVLIGIIAATVFGRSIGTTQINLVGQVAKIRNHIRFPQSMAMKRNAVWGFKSDGLSPTTYWIFTGTDPDNASNYVVMPGEEQATVTLPSTLTMDGFTVFFDSFGRPDLYDIFPTNPVVGDLSKNVTAAGVGSRQIIILEETGLIK